MANSLVLVFHFLTKYDGWVTFIEAQTCRISFTHYWLMIWYC